MRLTHLGHASLYVETADVRVLIDPVLIDPHQEGLFEIFPKRTVCCEDLPPFEILFISHRHLDHFDIATLARLPRDVQVVIPEDPLLVDAFETLGYERVECVQSFSTFTVAATRFLVTPSQGSIPEHGLVISDADGTFWNQVDTVLGAAQIDLVLSQAGPIDLLLATWQPVYGVWNNGVVLPTNVEILNPLALIFSNKTAFDAVIWNQLEEARALGWFSQQSTAVMSKTQKGGNQGE